MQDFTLKSYTELLKKLVDRKYIFVSVLDYFQQLKTTSQIQKILILRHDVDRLPKNSLDTAVIENELGIKGTYYFRIVKESYDEFIITQIAKLGHEIGYHYEDIDLAIQNEKLEIKNEFDKKKMIELAYASFCRNLKYLRKNFDIKTICMHGSPLSKYDNKLIWSKYDYRQLSIIGEPYLDIDWNKFDYLTDTGRRWDGIAIRDEVKRNHQPAQQDQQVENTSMNLTENKYKYRTTFDIVHNIEKLPHNLMITIHPERWTNNLYLWTKQLVLQNLKNSVKRVIVKRTAKH